MWLDRKEMSSYAFNNFRNNPDLISCITELFIRTYIVEILKMIHELVRT
jgi:hypothetical protein